MSLTRAKLLATLLLCVCALCRIGSAQKILDKLSCDFNDDSLCDWSFKGDAHFEPLFNNSNFEDDTEQDQVLLLRPSEESKKDHFVAYTIKSLEFMSGDYELTFNVNTNFIGFIFVIVIQNTNTESQILKITGSRQKKWETYSIKLPKFIKISVALEIKFEPDQIDFESDYLAINNLNIVDKRLTVDKCEYKCDKSDKCLSVDSICDTVRDCPLADDENQHCDKLPHGSYCSFRENFCHWFNYDNANSSGQWIHVYDQPREGYIGLAIKGVHKFGAISYLKSAIFEPIPLYHSIVSSQFFKSCKARFAYKFSSSSSDLALDLEPLVENEKWQPMQVWRVFNRQKSFSWENVSVPLPINFHHKYRLKLGFALGLRSAFSASAQKISVAIDNFSLSKECFAIDVPENEPRVPAFIPSLIKGTPFVIPRNRSIKSYSFTSCGAVGRKGPTYSQCESFYLNSSTRAAVFENENLSLNGSQMWTVPKSAYYTIFARGADGGSGLYNHSGGKGALVRAVFFLQEGDTIFISVGQSGADACSPLTEELEMCKSRNANSRVEVGGGGGGATYVFKFKPSLPEKWVPLLIAAGGGGGSGKANPDFKYSNNQHGRGFDFYNIGTAGNGAGSGGGWNYSKAFRTPLSNQTGRSLLYGAEGGVPCKRHTKWHTNGGFGGGGAGCQTGGGGGGFHGGNANKVSEAGDGGTSYADFGHSHLQLFSELDDLAGHERSKQEGLVEIVPQVANCCNEGRYSCLITGESANGSQMKECICGEDKFMSDLCAYERPFYLTLLWITLCMLLVIFLLFFTTYLYMQKRSAKHKLQRNESNDLRLLSSSATDVQLSRLRNHNILTEYNPNYEFGGSTCTLQDLREIPREKLNLVKALGQGAFGEVYQGYLHNMPDEITDELPVAVKTLPEYSANKQAEMDFLMEALIMSKFKHKNIVRFIGICFEKMPRFIVLELLPGGDLKTFLRESRSTIDSPSLLVMGDLLAMAIDVASGCQYLEEHHFIHRDIAARNCLLTSKVKMPSSLNVKTNQPVSGTFDVNNYQNGFNNSGIVVKIADFGMARDIYRADYYRKGGKAMLPVKWMPPEAFLDGVFTSKTDVWSFGVLLWEVMSMGYMPYPGRGNQEVMQLVTAGGRLDPPNSSTPAQVYAIMTQCWNGTPEFRPNFGTIIERVGYCLQDAEVLDRSLPVFHRSASMEKDMTQMRPPPDATDYLVPNIPGSQTNSNYSMATEKTELLSPDTCSTLSCANDDKLVELDDQLHLQDRNIKLWQDDVLAHQMLPFGVNINSYHPSESIHKQPFNAGIVLNPTSLNYQQPCVRYVNVNVNNELFGCNPSSSPNLDDISAPNDHANKDLVNC